MTLVTMKLTKRALLVGSLLLLAPNIALAQSELKEHVKWAIFHQGCRVYVVAPANNSFNQSEASISWLRQCFYNAQSHSVRARDLITQANDQTLLQVTRAAAAEVPSQFNLAENFRWVAYHEGQMPAFRRMSAQGNFEGIRNLYWEKQAHNPNAANLLAAVTNRYIKDLIDSM